MDAARNTTLGEIAADAALERSDFLRAAAEQLERYLDANRDRIRDVGGLVLIDDEPDYLSVAPDGSFRSRTRYEDEVTGEWVSETEVIESAAELVELYNLADVFAAFAEAAREEAGLPEEPTATEDLLETSGAAVDRVEVIDDDVYAQAADDWAAARGAEAPPDTEEGAARRLYDLALTFQERSQHSEARLVEQFETAASSLSPQLGDVMIVDDDDERLTLRSNGSFTAEVVPEDAEGTWRRLDSPDEIVEFYDPTDVFGDVAEAIAEAWPVVSGDYDEDGASVGEGATAADAEDARDEEDVEDVEDADDVEPTVSDGRDRLPDDRERR